VSGGWGCPGVGDVLNQGSKWLEKQRHKHMTRTVTYERGSESVDLKATFGKTVFELDNGFGVLEKTETRDFLIRTKDLVLASEKVLPKRGDKIKEKDGDMTYVYEVMAPGTPSTSGRQPHYRFSDPYRRTLRIHTKQVDVIEV